VAEVESLLSLGRFSEGEWRPPIVRTQATTGVGIDELMEAIDRFQQHSVDALETRRRGRYAAQLRSILSQRLLSRVDSSFAAADLNHLVARISSREIDPYTAAEQVLARIEKR
jgi:LAO/AO transport system kinase